LHTIVKEDNSIFIQLAIFIRHNYNRRADTTLH
jgi:hypothetical protein